MMPAATMFAAAGHAARPASLRCAAAGLLIALVAIAPAPARAASGTEAPAGDGVAASLQEGRRIVLMVSPRKGEGWRSLARRFCKASMPWQRLAEGSRGGPRRGERYALPFDDLTDEWQVRALRALFPADGFEGRDWIHRPGRSAVSTYGEGLWDVAEWLTAPLADDPAEVRSLAGEPLSDAQVARGDVLRVPGELLRPSLRRLAPDDLRGELERDAARVARILAAPAPGDRKADGKAPPAKPADPPPPPLSSLKGANGDLRYGEDDRGRHAIYRLKAGEALYSAVVVRFTGRLDPEEVNQVAEEIARASGIRDVTDISVGHPVRIPMALLLPEFLPPGDPRRLDHDRALAEAGRYRNPARVRNLEGVHVILDAGHGGVDHGAISNGVHEHEYAYDVMCRLKRRLEKYTAATVHPTIVDRRLGFTPRDGRRLGVNEAEQILTSPRHSNRDRAAVIQGVNLRWYLANSIYRKLRAQGVPSERVVFISIHADSLHRSVSGGMVYIPGARYRRGTYGNTGKAYARYREVREKPRISFTRSEGVQSEGLSREFASRVVESMRRHGLAVHKHVPIRERIIRRKRAWVPAVLRGNEVPVKVLVEIANINNGADARRVKDPQFREKTARALVDALLRYYGPA